jgi:antitoxin component YwqK of YwqJK toxin-antitoxin module
MEAQLQKKKNTRDETVLFYLDNDKKLHGLYRCYYTNGKLKEECTYKHGLFHGLMRSWHPNEKPEYTGEFHNGKHVGTHQEWHPNGGLRSSIEYNEDGGRDGETRYWRPDGVEMEYYNYMASKRTGRGYFNWPNGKLAMEYFFDNGKLLSEKYYPENRN